MVLKTQVRNLLQWKVLATTLISTMGRPKSKPDQAKSQYIRFRVTKAERAKIMRKWKSANAKNEASWIRNLLLGDE